MWLGIITTVGKTAGFFLAITVLFTFFLFFFKQVGAALLFLVLISDVPYHPFPHLCKGTCLCVSKGKKAVKKNAAKLVLSQRAEKQYCCAPPTLFTSGARDVEVSLQIFLATLKLLLTE